MSNTQKCRRIVVILDESGSMSGIRQDIIDGMNKFITEQKKVEPEANHEIMYTFVKFSTNVYPTIETQFCQVKQLTQEDYVPSGMTALYDAMGLTFEKIKDERNVAVMIVTDGQENSSSKYNRNNVFKMVKDLELNKNWKFAYLSSDIDTWEQGNDIGLSNTFKMSSRGVALGGGKCNQITDYTKLGNQISSGYNNQVFSAMRTSNVINKANDSVVVNETEKKYHQSIPRGYIHPKNTQFHPTKLFHPQHNQVNGLQTSSSLKNVKTFKY